MYRAASQEQTTPGEKYLMSTETFVTSVICYKFQKKSLILYNFFVILYMYIAPEQGLTTPLGMKFWCQQDHLVTSVICCKLKKSLWSLILYNFFHDFIHVYSPRAGADSPTGDKSFLSTEMSCHFIHLLQV